MCWKKSHDLLSSALIASTVCSICGALHEYSWYGVATLSNGCRCVLFFWSMEKFRLNAGLIWFNNSIKEWHKWLGVAGFGLKSSSEDLERIIYTLSLLMLLTITWQYSVYFSFSLCNTLNCPLASSFFGPENILRQPLIWTPVTHVLPSKWKTILHTNTNTKQLTKRFIGFSIFKSLCDNSF